MTIRPFLAGAVALALTWAGLAGDAAALRADVMLDAGSTADGLVLDVGLQADTAEAPVRTGPPCWTTDVLDLQLGTTGFERVGSGLMNGGSLFTLYVDRDAGTWAGFRGSAAGVTCLVVLGEHFEMTSGIP
ncbi:MAG: hypothetical protein ACU0BF_01850 [Paracoccaceae bacterium]